MRILYFSTVHWKWIKQRPQFIAYYLSQFGHEVDYFSLIPFGKARIKQAKIGQLHIMDTYVLPFSLRSRLVEKANIRYIRSLLAKQKYDVVILTSPLHHHYLPERIKDQCTIIYECMDNMPYFYEGDLRERMLANERKTLELADAVITSSDALKDEISSRLKIHQHFKIRSIYNALDKDTFLHKPKQITLNEPNLMYIGTIGPWLDWDVLHEFAMRHPNYTLYLVGPKETDFNTSPNIVWMGSVPHEEVLNYIYSADVLLLPFKVNELTKCVDPVKLYEYQALHKPILSSYWPELMKFKTDNLLFYETSEEFEQSIHQLSHLDTKNELNMPWINEHNWENRVREYIEFIEFIQNQS